MLSVISGFTSPGSLRFSSRAQQVGRVAREVVVVRCAPLQLELDAEAQAAPKA